MRRTDISPNAKLLYGLILSLSTQTGYCYASDDYLSEEMGVGKRQVQRLVAELESLRVVLVTGATNKRHITPTYDRNVISYVNQLSKAADELTTDMAQVDELTTDPTCQLTTHLTQTHDISVAIIDKNKKREKKSLLPSAVEKRKEKAVYISAIEQEKSRRNVTTLEQDDLIDLGRRVGFGRVLMEMDQILEAKAAEGMPLDGMIKTRQAVAKAAEEKPQ